MWRIKGASGQAGSKGEADAGGQLDNPRTELQKPQANGVELDGGERACLRDRTAALLPFRAVGIEQ